MKTPCTCGIVQAAMLAAVALALSGCGIPNLIAYPFAERDATRAVPAEYDLTAERLLILPYAGHDMLFESPSLGYDIGQRVASQIYDNLRGRVKVIVNPAQVEAYQQRRLDWPSMPVAEIGREFGATKVLYIEMRRFTIMEERSANLYRGRAEARVQVYDSSPGGGGEMLYDGEAEIEFPDDRPASTMEISETQLRQITLGFFAREVVRKFHDHSERRLGSS